MRYLILLLIVMTLPGCLFYRTDDCKLTFFKPSYMKRDRPVSKEDIQILTKASEILSDESHWNRKGNRLCFYDKKWSLFCALAKASVEVTGKYKHRRVAMQETRFTIDDNFHDRWKKHHLMDFNNNPSTTFKDIKWVLDQTKTRLESRYRHNPAR